jgi:dCMP deaminase
MPHCTPETCGPGQRCLHTSHAEENALGFCDGPVGTAYVTDEPCLTCTRALVRRGIRRVVFLRPYASIGDQERVERNAILGHFGVQWVHLSLD